ncbi:MAG: Unknown protein [uncultured Sulfurovum sp.]|uniref:Uncharacterized protein n=1 Tax=uncultured Sulfurovum sp. TaxID=269237 RepID=A0A6S6T9V7_9BACT|nr:MAG: Unknown protein [uncultured Sulfurovum sp.]
MVQIGIANIAKNPAILDSVDYAIEIVNKKTKEIKGLFIPIAYREMIQDALDEIAYQQFLKQNSSLLYPIDEDDTLLDGLDDEY